MTDDLLARLRARRTQSDHKRGLTTWPPINPDGEEAADRIEALEREIEGLRAEVAEQCARICEQQAQDFLSPQYATGQPLSSVQERIACKMCADAIRTALTAPSMKENEDGQS